MNAIVETPQLGLTLECAQECKRDMREAIARSSVGAAIEPVTVDTLTGLPAVAPAIPSQPRTKPKPVKPPKTKADKLTFLAKEYPPEGNPERLRAFVTWTFNGVRYLAFPTGQNVSILDENGGNYGSWQALATFRTRQARGDTHGVAPLGGVVQLQAAILREDQVCP